MKHIVLLMTIALSTVASATDDLLIQCQKPNGRIEVSLTRMNSSWFLVDRAQSSLKTGLDVYAWSTDDTSVDFVLQLTSGVHGVYTFSDLDKCGSEVVTLRFSKQDTGLHYLGGGYARNCECLIFE